MGVASLGEDHTCEINLAARAAWTSYIGDMTQSEIARRLNVSNARVHKLILLARRQGIVRVSIEGRPAECLELETKIAKAFGLMSCTISPYLATEDESPAMVRAFIGQAAGQVLARHLSTSDIQSLTVGVGGETLKAAMNAMPEVVRRDLVVYAGQGTLGPTLAARAFAGVRLDTIAKRVSDRDARCVFIAPATVDPSHTHAALAAGIASDLVMSERQATQLVAALASGG